jgi:hypothetical protein
MPQPLILCADDYALAPGVSRCILDLIAGGRLSATGAMTVSPFWAEHGVWLRPWATRIDVGLHLTLTDHQPLGPMPRLVPGGRLPPLGRLMAAALTGRLDAVEIAAELQRQVDRFTEVFGAPPAFIDGHQHVHLLPGIREAVVAAALALSGGCYVRSCREPVLRILRRGVAPAKALLIDRLGFGLDRLIRRNRLPANRGFRGIHDFSGKIAFGRLMARFLDPPADPGAPPGPPPLIMVHPGFPDDILRRLDPVTDQRQAEAEFLAGPQFPEMLETRGWALARFAQP